MNNFRPAVVDSCRRGLVYSSTRKQVPVYDDLDARVADIADDGGITLAGIPNTV